MLRLNAPDGTPIVVNTRYVVEVWPAPSGGSFVRTAESSQAWHVRQTMEEIGSMPEWNRDAKAYG